jgi:N-acetylneuraminate synthase/N,N'-diacetyllegionaminate synthase
MTAGFRDRFEIAGRPVGRGAPCLVIAEAGVSHFGDMGLARALVDLAAEARADVFKTQIFDVEALIAKRASDWRERLRPRNLTLAEVRELKERCEGKGLVFMATAHDETRIPWLRELDVAAVKVGSGERNNPAFVQALAGLGKPMIVSTGLSRETDVREALSACAEGGCDRVALLHCVTCYPTPPAEVNLAAMDRLAGLFEGPVGYSDHTEDGLAVLAAVARGARVVEKHITIRRNVPNAQDWKVSAGPEDLARLVADIRRVETMLGHGRKEPAPCEKAGALWALKSLVAARGLSPGHLLAAADLVAKRPGDGIAPNRIVDVVGRRLRRAVEADAPVRPEDLE